MPTVTERRVTVVVITHNRCEELDRTLTALAQLPERPVVVVVDNGSSDGTAKMVRVRFPEFGLLVSSEHLGAAARNHGVGAARTPYVAFCDDDTWYEAGGLTRAADLLDAHPRLAVVTAGIIVEPSGTLDPVCDRMARSPLEPQPGMPGHPLLSFPAGVSIVRRHAFLDAGGFCERLWLGGEEDLLGADLARQGWCMAYVPEVVARHHP
jgi:GT2 family glycosyltransferase